MSWNTPAEMKYLRSDEYIKLEGDNATIGISDYAQDQLNDIVFVELPDVGAYFAKGKSFGVVESVKAASDLMMPVSGTVTEVNSKLKDTPELVNSSPYIDGWFIKIKVDNPAEADDLMDAAAYEKYCESR
ncbi:MAG: glycine cleavage system protein GcvH [Chloroflexota bacterium]|nr:glycine cleavage system protein GcvH [Chloroflexota bacterium]